MTDEQLQDRVIWTLRDGRPLDLKYLCNKVKEPRKAAVEAAVRAVGGHVYQEGPRTRRLATLGMAGRLSHRNIIETMERAADLASWAAMEAIVQGLDVFVEQDPDVLVDPLHQVALDAVGGSSLSEDIRTVITDWVAAEMLDHPDIGSGVIPENL